MYLIILKLIILSLLTTKVNSTVGSEYPTFSKLLLELSVDRLRNLTSVTQENRRTLVKVEDDNTLTLMLPQNDENDDPDLAEPGYQDFMDRLSDVGLGYVIRDLYTSAITEDPEIETVLGQLGRIGVGAYIINKLGESNKFDESTSRSLRRLARYTGVGITIVGSYFDLYLLFDSIDCLVRRNRLEASTGMELEFTTEQDNQEPSAVFCKREHPILEIIAAVIATVSDTVTFATPQYGELAALIETLWQVIAFYYVEAEERKGLNEDHNNQRLEWNEERSRKVLKVNQIFRQIKRISDALGR